MRIIDKQITGVDITTLAARLHQSMNPKRRDGKYNESYPAGRLQKLDRSGKNPRYKSAIRYLFQRVDKLFTGDPEELISIHNGLHIHIANRFGNSNRLKENGFKKLMESVFGYYGTFRGGSRNLVFNWFAQLNLQTCPFCNRNWTTEVTLQTTGKRKLLFDIDHFFPQESYPCLKLSFYNLIPCCTICNQRIKGSKKLNLTDHLHPFIDDMDSIVKFDAQVDSLDLFYDKSAKINLKLKRKEGVLNNEFNRAEKTFKFFHLEDIYKGHNDYVRELIQKDVIYSKSYLDYLYKTFGGENNVFKSKSDLIKSIMGNYVLAEDIHKRPLAKLTKDLTESFEIGSFIE